LSPYRTLHRRTTLSGAWNIDAGHMDY